MARNLFDRGFADLFRPLDHQQYAPPLYLVAAKACGALFGYSELPLRLPALFGGILAAAGLLLASRRLRLGGWAALPLALLFANTFVLRYVTEVKPYGLDLGVAALLIAAALASPRLPNGKLLLGWSVAGIFAPWFSLPSVFVLAALGLRGLYHDRRWWVPIALWLLSFSALYYLVLSASIGTPYLNAFHRAYFLPMPTGLSELVQTGNIFLHLLRLSFGLTVFAISWGTASTIYALWYRPRLGWLLLPLVLSALASVLHYYTLLDRLMLFVLPGVWLVLASGIRDCWYRYPGRWRRRFLIGVSLVAVGGSGVPNLLISPLETANTRELARSVNGLRYQAHPLAEPALDYYLRIHTPPVATGAAQRPYREALEGNYRVVYDLLAAAGPREAMHKDSVAAAERGCRVTSERSNRVGWLTLKCP